MDRLNYYYGQLVKEDQLDLGFANAEQADWDQNRDCGMYGIVIPRYAEVPEAVLGVNPMPTSWTPEEDSPPSWNVRIATGYAYNKLGKRMAIDPPTTIVVDCEKDYLLNPNSVAGGKSRWISIFLQYAKALSDPKVDDNGATVYFVEDESYSTEVRQGPEETYPATTKPTVDSTDILLVDILIDDTIPPINDGDMDFTRTEKLVKMDTTGVDPGAPWIWIDEIEGRNVEEALMHAFRQLQYYISQNYIPIWGAAVGKEMEGDLLPKFTCDYLLGSAAKRWQSIATQALFEKPNYTDSGRSKFITDPDWEGQGGHAVLTKEFQGLAAYTSQFDDALARRHKRYLDVRDDFLYYQGHPGPYPGFKVTVVATGGVVWNPANYAQDMPNGFGKFVTPANGDSAKIHLDSYPFLADKDPYVEWAVNVQATAATTLIQIGMIDSTSNILLAWVFDPSGILNPAPNGNWWMAYIDGTNADIWIDSGVAPSAAFHTFAVAFEYEDLTGPVWIRWYRDGALDDERDLNALGGTYQALALAAAFDLQCVMATTTGGEELWADYYEAKQLRDF